MANVIKIKRGANADLGTLGLGEVAFATDTKKLLVGFDNDNFVVNPDTVDNLTSNDTDKALSANQGRIIVEEYLDGKKFKYLTSAEYEALSDDEKAKDEMVYILTDANDNLIDLSVYVTKTEFVDYLDGKKFRYLTTAEYEALSSAEKNRTDLVYVLTDVDDFILDLSGYATKDEVNIKAVDIGIDNGVLKLKDKDGNFIGTGIPLDDLKNSMGL